MSNLVFRIIKTCNQNCSYCFLRDLQNKNRNLSLKEIRLKIIENQPINSIYITGGEPTSSSYFYDVIDLLASFDLLSKTTIQTNGTSMYFNTRPDVFAHAGLKYFISVPSLYPENFFKCTQNKDPDALNKLLNNLEFLSASSHVVVNIVIDYEENFERLDYTLTKLLEMPIFYFNLSSIILPKESKIKSVNWNKINFKEIYNKIFLKNRYIKFDNFPSCILPRDALESKMVSVLSFEKKINLEEHSLEACGGERKYISSCFNCKQKITCKGFPLKYYYDFGEANINQLILGNKNED